MAPLTLAQALFMGLLQGASELFPVSSLGHAVIVPSLLHWSFKQSDPSFVPFLVLLHLGTATALLVLYRSEWVAIIRGFFTAAIRGQMKTDTERLAMLLLVGTIPAAVLGACQAFAFLPGISRSGVTIGGGLLAGLRHEEAARFSFLLATPVILGAGLVEVPGLFQGGVPVGEYLAAAVLAGIAAYASARFLLRYFRSGRLDPYGWYCLTAGLASLALLHFSL